MTKQILYFIVFWAMLLVNVNAQIPRSIQRGIQRGVESAVERAAEEAVSNVVDRAVEDAEAERERRRADIEAAFAELDNDDENAQTETFEPVAVPEVGNTPYTPRESEFAFFAMTPGVVQTYTAKDGNGAVQSQTRLTVASITGDRNAYAIAYNSEMLDQAGNPTDRVLNFRIVVKDGIMYLDMKEFFAPIAGIDGLEITGTPIKIPVELAVGQAIDDAIARVRIGFINCVSVMTDGKCTAIEDVTVEAGTFRCYKVSQQVNSRVLGVRSEGVIHNWYARGVGTVKTEHYDNSGKLLSSHELTSIK